MKLDRFAALPCGFALLLPASGTSQPSSVDLLGVWRNPRDTVHVRIEPCGTAVCGVVVWASEKANADVRRGSGRTLVGMKLVRDLVPADAAGWRGKVLVPDLNVTLTGLAEVQSDGTLRARGCLVGAMFCRSQIWTPVAPSTDPPPT